MSVAFDAAMVSGLPLNVPAMSYSSSTTGRYSSRVAPIAPHGRPPPIAFARQTMSGVTPNASTAPPNAIVAPVFTSSNARYAPCLCARSLSPCR